MCQIPFFEVLGLLGMIHADLNRFLALDDVVDIQSMVMHLESDILDGLRFVFQQLCETMLIKIDVPAGRHRPICMFQELDGLLQPGVVIHINVVHICP